jgi:hypothetical protein
MSATTLPCIQALRDGVKRSVFEHDFKRSFVTSRLD